MPMERRCGGTDDTARPWIKISPLVGESNPAIMRSSVVFPQPLGPRIVRTAPLGRVKLTSLTA